MISSTKIFTDVAVVYTTFGSRGILVVTFTPLQHDNFDPPKGFGQDFLRRAGIDTLCFVSRWDHWWQTDDMSDAIAFAQPICRTYRDVVTYGTSMGGYGALAFSKALGATRVLAFSPQYSIDQSKVPFETRWTSHARRVVFKQNDLNGLLSEDAEIILAYDPRSLDRRHIDLIDRKDIVHLKIPNVGHGVLGYLAFNRILQTFVKDVAAGVHQIAAVNKAALARRREFPAYWMVLADTALRRRRYTLALTFLDKANAFGENAVIAIKIARTLQQTERFEEAGFWFTKAGKLQPDDPTFTRLAARSYMKAGTQLFKDGAFDDASRVLVLAAELAPDDDRIERLFQKAFAQAHFRSRTDERVAPASTMSNNQQSAPMSVINVTSDEHQKPDLTRSDVVAPRKSRSSLIRILKGLMDRTNKR